LYTYVENNPVVGVDPEGTDPALLCGALILIVFFGAGWYLKSKFEGHSAPWNKALNLHKAKSPVERQRRAVKIGKEGKPYMGAMILETLDKMLSTNPLTGPGYSAIKAAYYAAIGDVEGAVRNVPCVCYLTMWEQPQLL
jgi:hypothetical protein